MNKKVLVLAAHPDDETLGVGGTILKHKNDGDLVTVFIVTDGVTVRHNNTEIQKQAALKACKILNVNDVYFGDLPDQRLDGLPLFEVIEPIFKIVKDIQPDVVYTHHGGDVNQDHRVIFNATLVAVRPVNKNSVKEVYCYEVPSSTEWAPPKPNWAFLPNIYVDINNFLEKKIEALLSYSDTFQSEIPPYPHPRSIKAVKMLAQKRGIEVGLKAAESFLLIRKLQ